MAFIETICLLIVVVVLLYIYLTRNHNYWAKRKIPFDKPIPFFGNMVDSVTMKRNPGQIAADMYKKYKKEKVVGMFSFMKPSLMIRDPSLVSQILTTDFHHFANNDFQIDEKLDPVLSKNIFVQRGERWKRGRQALSPAFTVGKIKSTFDKIQNLGEKLVKYLEKNPELEVKSTMSRYTSEVVASWGIGIDGHSFDSEDPILPKLGKMMFEPSFATGLAFTIMSFSPVLPKLLRLRFTPKEVPEFFDKVLRDLIKDRAKTQVQHKDFLQYFVELKKKRDFSKNDDQNEVTDDDIISGIVSFFIEGYETSSIILSLLLYHLVKNPEIQKQLRQEVDDLFEKSGRQFTFDGISDLSLLSRIYSETVRLHGALMFTKVCTQDCTLNLGEGKSLKVDKGTPVIIPVLGLHMDPEYWPNPEKFDPNRFADDATHIKGTYIPFGDGPRICIGMRIASAIIKTATVYIIRNFELLPTKKTAPRYEQEQKHFLSYLKGGVHMRFVKREI